MEAEVGISAETFRNVSRASKNGVEHRTSALTSDLNDLVSSNQQEPDPVNQRWVAAQHGAKIGVKKDGFYRVSSNELVAANFPIASDPTKWRLFLNGVEQAIIVASGGQYIEFYGKGLDLAESDTRIYYLISGTVPGKRISSRIVRPAAGFATSLRYPVIAEKKERTNYVEFLFNGDEDNYLGHFVPSSEDIPSPVPFTVTGIDTSIPTVQLTVKLRGFNDIPHSVRIFVNEHELAPATGIGKVFFSSTLTIPTSFLVEGVNVLNLSRGEPNDFNYFDSVTVKYSRKYQAEQNKISFFTPGYRKVDITGFSSSNVRVFDLTFDGTPTLLANIPIAETGGSYTVKIPSSRTMVGYAVENSGLLQAPSIVENNASTLSLATNAADMVIISYSAPSFMEAAEVWANYRRSAAGGGYSVRVIDVADIYDEFNFGIFGAAGIKSFLEFAHTQWLTKPRYVLLVGDGSYDPRNYLGYGYLDLIPSQSVGLILHESVSDDALADFDDDGLSEIAIGRIPAGSATTISTAYNKTVLFETPAQQSLNRGALFAHDFPSGFDFENMNEIMAAQLPPGTPISNVSRSSPTAQDDLVNQMNTGKFIVNYAGHGATGLWAGSDFFSNSTVPRLTNAQGPTIFNMLTCLNGYFVRPDADSLSETLLKNRNGGAVASWASTSETTPDIQLIMGTRFFNRLGAGNIPRMGDLIRDAKTAITNGTDVRLSWVLIGDPALKVR